MTRTSFEKHWKAVKKSKTCMQGVMGVVETHLVTGKSIKSVVRSEYKHRLRANPDFIDGLIMMAEGYKKYRM